MIQYKEGAVESVLTRLNIYGSQRNNEIMSTCPMHYKITGKNDSNPSWSINVATGVHHCFSCGYKGNLIILIADILSISYDEAKLWLKKEAFVDISQVVEALESLKDSYIAPTYLAEMSEARLEVFTDPPEHALGARGLSLAVCQEYKIKWSTANDAWIIPIRDPYTGRLWGWQEKGQGNRYFKNRPAGINKSRSLFGLGELSKEKIMVVVESPLDVVKMASWGYYIGVATYGASISKPQRQLLSSASKLVIAMDNPKLDAAGLATSKEFIKLARSMGMEYSFFNYGDSGMKDIGDMDQETFENGLVTAKHCSLGLTALGV